MKILNYALRELNKFSLFHPKGANKSQKKPVTPLTNIFPARKLIPARMNEEKLDYCANAIAAMKS